MGFAKVVADRSSVSTFCFSIWPQIGQGVIILLTYSSSSIFINLASVSRCGYNPIATNSLSTNLVNRNP